MSLSLIDIPMGFKIPQETSALNQFGSYSKKACYIVARVLLNKERHKINVFKREEQLSLVETVFLRPIRVVLSSDKHLSLLNSNLV